MRVDVITLHAVQNYGSVLQTYATQKLLESYGCDVTIIDFTKDAVKYENLQKVWGKGNIVKELVMFPTIQKWKKVFRGFCEKELNLSTRTYSIETDFYEYPLNADAYCTGSDQVWNSTWNNGIILPLYLSFVPERYFKFALSASFGNDCILEDEVNATKNYINQYRHISVREASAIEILKKQYKYDNCQLTLDPTLSMQADFWRKMETPRKISQDYILIYNLNRSKEFDEYALELAKRTGLKLVRLCTRYDQFYRPGISVLIPSVYEFISLIDNATYVLTDSFHATAFSMNMNTEPICVYPKSFSSRIDSFLHLTESSQKKVNSYSDFDVLNRKVDFECVNQILDAERIKMSKYIQLIIDGIKSQSRT